MRHSEEDVLDSQISGYSVSQRLSGERGNVLVIPEEEGEDTVAYLASKYHLVFQQLTQVARVGGDKVYTDSYDTPCTNNIVHLVA